MKIRDIISEAKEDDLDRRMDAYFRRKLELEKEKERRSQPSTIKAAPTGSSNWGKLKHYIKQGKEKLDRATYDAERGWERFSRHPVVKPK